MINSSWKYSHRKYKTVIWSNDGNLPLHFKQITQPNLKFSFQRKMRLSYSPRRLSTRETRRDNLSLESLKRCFLSILNHHLFHFLTSNLKYGQSIQIFQFEFQVLGRHTNVYSFMCFQYLLQAIKYSTANWESERTHPPL